MTKKTWTWCTVIWPWWIETGVLEDGQSTQRKAGAHCTDRICISIIYTDCFGISNNIRHFIESVIFSPVVRGRDGAVDAACDCPCPFSDYRVLAGSPLWEVRIKGHSETVLSVYYSRVTPH